MNPDERFISSIYNYCDRWCEKCDFTSRCRVFADELSHAPEDSNDPMGDAIASVGESFDGAKQMLMGHAEEMDIDIEAAMNDPEIDVGIERQRMAVEDNEAFKLAHEYALDRKVFETADSWLPPEDDPAAGEMMEILHWYHFFIAAKINRGLHGLLDLDGYQDDKQLIDPQSDANGSIKLALIAIERSQRAWTYLLSDSNTDVLNPQIEKLENIKSLVENKFPHAREFIRPGFDELEAVM